MTHGTFVEERGHGVDLAPSSSSTSIPKITPGLDVSKKRVTIELIKGEAGFGFNVVGGSDSQHLPGDYGIYVSLIKEDGVADQDGRLKEGDKILAVNGLSLADIKHDDAVKILREIKMYSPATLLVQPEAEITILEQILPIASSPFYRPPPEDSKQHRSNAAAVLSFGDSVTLKSALFGQGKRKEEDEDSLYAPSTHSIIDDVPRTPLKKANLYDRMTPLVAEVAYVGIGLAAISAACFLTFKIWARQRQ